MPPPTGRRAASAATATTHPKDVARHPILTLRRQKSVTLHAMLVVRPVLLISARQTKFKVRVLAEPIVMLQCLPLIFDWRKTIEIGRICNLQCTKKGLWVAKEVEDLWL